MYPFALEAESTKIETILFGEFLRLIKISQINILVGLNIKLSYRCFNF